MTVVVAGLALLAAGAYGARRAPATPPGLTGPGAGSVVHEKRALMGSIFEMSVWAPRGREPQAAESLREAMDATARMEAEISNWKPETEVSALNRAAGGELTPVGKHTRTLLERSLYWSELTGGAFDITGGPLFELWDAARKVKELPAVDEIGKRKALVGYRNITLQGDRAGLAAPGMRVGFGAIGKGYAADQASALLTARGFPDHIIDAGGDLVLRGSRGGEPWSVGVRDPRGNGMLAVVSATNCGLATSGDYERYFTIDGKRYSHIIDLRTGWPSRGVVSATVLAPSGMDADALATSMVVLGVQAGIRLASSLPGVEALLVDENRTTHTTAGWALDDGRLVRK
ncbi:MAG: FAD:protein FMN transferase [Myxococcota bacterium]